MLGRISKQICVFPFGSVLIPFFSQQRCGHMSKYIISQPESEKNTEETNTQGQDKKRKRRKYIKPAGEREHSINSISPKLRTSPIVEIPIEKQKSITIALIGPPNVGKSTILNQFVRDKV